MSALASGIELERVIGASSDEELAFIVEVEGGNVCVGLGEFE